MLIISLPTGLDEGECRINGETAQYRIDGESLAFRYDESGPWDCRRIIESTHGGIGHTFYFCADDADPDVDQLPDLIIAKPPVIASHSRHRGISERRPLRNLRRLPLHRELVAEAVHQAVCDFTNSDGCRMCMYYAVAGSWLLSHLTGITHMPQVGSLRFLAEPPDGWIEIDIHHWGDPLTSLSMGEFHAWIAVANDQPTIGRSDDATVIDLTTRHFKQLAEATSSGESLEWSRPEPPKFVWEQCQVFPSWIHLIPDEIATTSVVTQLKSTLSEWENLFFAARDKYELLLRRDAEQVKQDKRRQSKKAARRRKHKHRR